MRESTATIGAGRIAFEAFGVHMEVSVSPADMLHRLRPLLPPGWQPSSRSAVQKSFGIALEGPGLFALLRDGEPFVAHLPFELALDLLDAQVRAYVALHAPDRIFVHAGVVGHRGRAIVIPGLSFSGKTTLVAALVRAGASYYSDEYAPLDEHGLVHPYAKPLSLRDEWQVQHDSDVSSIGGTAGVAPLPVGAVVATTYVPGSQWCPRRLSAGNGLLALLSHTVAAQTRPQQVMRVLRRCVDGAAVVIESPRDDASQLASLLLAELEG